METIDKTERSLQRLEKKLKVVPVIGKKVSEIPTIISLLRKYLKKEYQDLPIGTLIAILAACIYFILPIDLIPEGFLFVGLVDDAAVITGCLKLIESDVQEYKEWRKNNHMIIE